MARKEYLYQHYTWVELKEVAARNPVVVIPVGSVEDHGPHLPLDTDNFLISSICEEAARRANGDILLMPLIPMDSKRTTWISRAPSTSTWNTCSTSFWM